MLNPFHSSINYLLPPQRCLWGYQTHPFAIQTSNPWCSNQRDGPLQIRQCLWDKLEIRRLLWACNLASKDSNLLNITHLLWTKWRLLGSLSRPKPLRITTENLWLWALDQQLAVKQATKRWTWKLIPPIISVATRFTADLTLRPLRWLLMQKKIIFPKSKRARKPCWIFNSKKIRSLKVRSENLN